MTNFKNKLKIYPIVLLLLINIFMPCVINSSPHQWPKITRESKPWTRWWWLGNSVNRKDLTPLVLEFVSEIN